MNRPLSRTLADALVFLIAVAISILTMRGAGFLGTGDGNARVIDGDSLALADRRGETEVRLYGIDAPEFRQSCEDENGFGWACGREAARQLRGLIDGRDVSCRYLRPDAYGRLLAECAAKGTRLNEELVRRGFAVAYHDAPRKYVRLEDEARAAKAGIWRGKFVRPEDWRAAMRPREGGMSAAIAPED